MSSRWGLTNVLYRLANADMDSSENDCLIINSIRHALEAASLQRMEGGKEAFATENEPVELANDGR